MLQFLKKIFPSPNDRLIASLHKQVDAINALEATYEALSDEALQAKTAEFKENLQAGQTVDAILADAFAVVREASKRTLGLRHFDIQLIGAMVLNDNMIAEMKTGEGKTLVATLAVYLNALSEKGVHVVTVNDYLARRDCAWMGQIYHFLGLSTGVIVPGISEEERIDAYKADITYGTNSEFAFDYLRDNLKLSPEHMVQRGHHFAIVDEVDSILIDEARTPLIISGPVSTSTDLYKTINSFIPLLNKSHFDIDEKARSISLNEKGIEEIEQILRKKTSILGEASLYDYENISLVHHIDQALKAHHLFDKDKDYIVKNGAVIIIDEFTGRMMEGRRYSDGLHQAIEAKEKVKVQQENQTIASITFQNYFRLYTKLAGMTGTALTEAPEFEEIYHLSVVDIPTHLPLTRHDYEDEIYKTSQERDRAVIEQIIACVEKGQPVLVGTVSIEKSEDLAKQLKKAKIKHNVLNARHHADEATIIAEAGTKGAVTIATNMAGRGTDIQLGGNLDRRLQQLREQGKTEDEVQALSQEITTQIEQDKQAILQAGGLFVIGTERHESRRIDNQLRGRSGRQGDKGETKFYISLQDDLMRIFGSERIEAILTKLGLEDGEAIQHGWISKAIEKAQQKVEGRNFEIRKQLLEYDDVMNDQRKVIFEQRLDIMHAEHVNDVIEKMHEDVVETIVTKYIPENAAPEDWDVQGLQLEVKRIYNIEFPIDKWANEDGVDEEILFDRIFKHTKEIYKSKEKQYGADIMRMAEKNLLLQIIDHHWKEHLLQLDHLRGAIGLRAYGQRNPLSEYKQEAFEYFNQLLHNLKFSVIQLLYHVEFVTPKEKEAMAKQQQNDADYQAPHQFMDNKKTPRNAPCTCGSGKKYKHCHGRAT